MFFPEDELRIIRNNVNRECKEKLKDREKERDRIELALKIIDEALNEFPEAMQKLGYKPRKIECQRTKHTFWNGLEYYVENYGYGYEVIHGSRDTVSYKRDYDNGIVTEEKNTEFISIFFLMNRREFIVHILENGKWGYIETAPGSSYGDIEKNYMWNLDQIRRNIEHRLFTPKESETFDLCSLPENEIHDIVKRYFISYMRPQDDDPIIIKFH